MKLLITGGAGYVGAMLVHQYAARPDVEDILSIDKDPSPAWLKDEAGMEKVAWVQANLGDFDWQEQAAGFMPDVVIHTAWQIRELFGRKKLQWKWNVEGSENVFDFAFSTPSVKKLIHFSTASVYGAYPENSLDYRFKEADSLREEDYLYGAEKKKVEEILREKYERTGTASPQIFIIRPAAITGPRGRYMLKNRFGLQSALSGSLKGGFVNKIISFLTSAMPATPKWARQFIHEDDVVDIVSKLVFSPQESSYEIFNIAPNGEIVRAKDMGRAVGKKVVILPPTVVRAAFFLLWNIFRGKIPTSPGGWKIYSYPILMDGTKSISKLGHNYKLESFDAFTKKEGRYMKYAEKN